ncbi:hypothetical protein M0805_008403 [Coniferiporia weirii]|nr:hypothetical protein M0805_008403 [Coniferiporia weirii]
MSFPFRNQPFKALYLTFAIATIAFVRIPYWFCTSLTPAWRPHRSWGVGRSVFVRVFSAFLDIILNVGLFSKTSPNKWASNSENNGFTWIEATPELVVGEIAEKAKANNVKPDRVFGFWYGRKGEHGKYTSKPKEGEKVVLYFHGKWRLFRGDPSFSLHYLRLITIDWKMGGAAPNDIYAKVYRDLLEHCPTVSRVFSLDYRLSSAKPFVPSDAFPAALIDAIAGYNYLITTMGFQSADVIVAGDSAGGLIAYMLSRYLVANQAHLDRSADGHGLGVPGGLLMLSPAAEFVVTHDGPGTSWVENRKIDTVQRIVSEGYALRAILGTLPEEEGVRNSWISPASLALPAEEIKGLFAGFPKTLIIEGGVEQMVDSVRTLKERMTADIGDKVTYYEQPGGIHIYMILPFFDTEVKECYKRIRNWLEAP